MARVLLVEDQGNVRRSMALVLQHAGYEVREAANVSDAIEVLGAADVDVVVSDIRMQGDADGVALLEAIRRRDVQVDLEVILVTAFGTIEDAVEAIKGGAYDYLTKPVDPERLLITVRRAVERRQLAREVQQLRAQVGPDEFIAVSQAMRNVLKNIAQLASTDSTVLIVGESGTGKELVARALHEGSRRRSGKFVAVNCGALSETLLESELFGHRKGAFTGAITDKKGLLEEAHGGVLFLDEIGEMPQSMQVALLRFLQGGEVRRIGETATRRADVRLIAATHRSLDREVAAGRFREDFYYRVNVVGLSVPPLRDRREDIPALASYFVRRLSAKLRRNVSGIAPAAMNLLTAYDWPGNVRELENALERALNMASGDLITEADLPSAVTVSVTVGAMPATATQTQDERARLVASLEECHWNQRRAAQKLGISRTTLWRKLREHRIDI